MVSASTASNGSGEPTALFAPAGDLFSHSPKHIASFAWWGQYRTQIGRLFQLRAVSVGANRILLTWFRRSVASLAPETQAKSFHYLLLDFDGHILFFSDHIMFAIIWRCTETVTVMLFIQD
jgi:hypothetical protein